MIIVIMGTIPHKEQRYNTQGDWWFDGTPLQIRADLELSEDEQWCTLVHELVEAVLCKYRFGDDATKIVDKWDKSHKKSKDPGSLKGCPYKREHEVASIIENILRLELDGLRKR